MDQSDCIEFAMDLTQKNSSTLGATQRQRPETVDKNN
jgi:hypothetical protein